MRFVVSLMNGFGLQACPGAPLSMPRRGEGSSRFRLCAQHNSCLGLHDGQLVAVFARKATFVVCSPVGGTRRRAGSERESSVIRIKNPTGLLLIFSKAIRRSRSLWESTLTRPGFDGRRVSRFLPHMGIDQARKRPSRYSVVPFGIPQARDKAPVRMHHRDEKKGKLFASG